MRQELEDGICPQCGREFKGTWGVQTHMRRIHKDETLMKASPWTKKQGEIVKFIPRTPSDLHLEVLPLVVVYDPETGRRGLLEWDD